MVDSWSLGVAFGHEAPGEYSRQCRATYFSDLSQNRYGLLRDGKRGQPKRVVWLTPSDVRRAIANGQTRRLR